MPRRASQLSNGLPVWPSVDATTFALFDEILGSDDGSERQVAVAADHLGHRVHDQTGAMIDRTADQRRERVVDDQGNAGFTRDRRHESRSATRSKGFEMSRRKSAASSASTAT